MQTRLWIVACATLVPASAWKADRNRGAARRALGMGHGAPTWRRDPALGIATEHAAPWVTRGMNHDCCGAACATMGASAPRARMGRAKKQKSSLRTHRCGGTDKRNIATTETST